jgi:hypothetical protein
LEDILPLDKFEAMIPRPLREHPHLELLYRELQLQRARTLDAVAANIAHECHRGERLQQQVRRSWHLARLRQQEKDIQRRCGLATAMKPSHSSSSGDADGGGNGHQRPLTIKEQEERMARERDMEAEVRKF